MDFDNAGGVYSITNTITGAVYIGATGDFPSERWKKHQAQLRLGKHANWYFQADWNKYGKDAFELAVLEYAHPVYLREREQHWLDRYWDEGIRLYNTRQSTFKLSGSWLVPYWDAVPPVPSQEHTAHVHNPIDTD